MSSIVVAGGSGLLGGALVRALRTGGHRVTVLTRHPSRDGDVRWSPGTQDDGWTAVVATADAVVNLAGESIAGGRWTTARKTAIRESRVQATNALVRAIAAAPRPPAAFLSSSAVGYYGPGAEPATETTGPGADYLASVCAEWEGLARQVEAVSRVVLLRSGVALAAGGGALPQLALPFKLFAGGPAGSGRQYVSWIHVHDWVALVQWALATTTLSGPLNLTAPAPVTNAEFAEVLGRVLHRPSWLRAPGFALRLALGEMADALVLGGQRVLPAAAKAAGFVFRYPTLESALRDIYERKP
jgi:hypothetical protein